MKQPIMPFCEAVYTVKWSFHLKEHMGRRIKVIKGKKDGGSLQIEFFDEDDLKTLANLLSPDK